MQDSAAIKNVTSLNGYYRKIHFGFAAGRLNLPPDRIPECTDRKSFSAAELPYEYLHPLPERTRKQLTERFSELHCGSLFAPELTALIPDAGKKIQREFIRTCAGMFRDLISGGIKYCALDFSLLQLVKDDSGLLPVRQLLRKLHPVLQETGMTILLPVRLPLPDPGLCVKITDFLRSEMIPNLKLRLEIHPHELKQESCPEELAGTFRLETGSVLFCCNADGGNRILRAHLTPWLRYFSLTGFPGPYFFCPFSQHNRLAAIESEAFSKLAEAVCSEPVKK